MKIKYINYFYIIEFKILTNIDLSNIIQKEKYIDKDVTYIFNLINKQTNDIINIKNNDTIYNSQNIIING